MHKEVKNKSLNAAKRAKRDEFYTQLTDIEKELHHYKDHFRNKVVFCNCDDPEWSNFWHFFAVRFNLYGLKKLISTHYEPSGKPSYMLSMERIGNETSTTIKHLSGDGDFRSLECVELLKEADIVVTNPPFSLFREYVSQLMTYEKKFLIIGNKNAVKYKEIFPLLKENKIWVGYRNMNQDMWLIVPDGEKYEKIVDGKKLKHIMACWYTNMDIKKRHEDMKLIAHYSPDKYPQYDNYDAIDVCKVIDIPCDYYGMMGVPITFMDKYNPEQFEIVGVANHGSDNEYDLFKPVLHGKELYTRILIRRRGSSATDLQEVRYFDEKEGITL